MSFLSVDMLLLMIFGWVFLLIERMCLVLFLGFCM